MEAALRSSFVTALCIAGAYAVAVGLRCWLYVDRYDKCHADGEEMGFHALVRCVKASRSRGGTEWFVLFVVVVVRKDQPEHAPSLLANRPRVHVFPFGVKETVKKCEDGIDGSWSFPGSV